MEFQEEQAIAPPPSQKKSYPWEHRVNYRSGKVAAAFAAKAVPEDVKAGFAYYDNDEKKNVQMHSFRAIIVASLSGISGVTKDAGDHYTNYWSNLVNDTRDEALEVRAQGIDRALFTGFYADIKPSLPQGVGYSQVLIAYIPEAKAFMSLNLTMGLQNHLKNSIANATGAPPKKISLFSLCDLSSQYWGFKFTGSFTKVDKDGFTYAGSGDMYFMPEVEAFVINQKPGLEQQFELLNGGADACQDYVKAEQNRIYGAKPKPVFDAVEPQAQPAHQTPPPINATALGDWPTVDLSSAPEPTDDLPF